MPLSVLENELRDGWNTHCRASSEVGKGDGPSRLLSTHQDSSCGSEDHGCGKTAKTNGRDVCIPAIQFSKILFLITQFEKEWIAKCFQAVVWKMGTF